MAANTLRPGVRSAGGITDGFDLILVLRLEHGGREVGNGMLAEVAGDVPHPNLAFRIGCVAMPPARIQQRSGVALGPLPVLGGQRDWIPSRTVVKREQDDLMRGCKLWLLRERPLITPQRLLQPALFCIGVA